MVCTNGNKQIRNSLTHLLARLLVIHLASSIVIVLAPNQRIAANDLTQTPVDQDGELEKIKEKYEIEIVANAPRFPVATRHGKIEGARADGMALKSYVPLFAKEFNLYPFDLVKRSRLKRIVLCEQLRFAGQRRNAMPDYEHNTLYLDARRGSHSKPNQRAVIHHEFFHMVDYRDDGSVYRDPDWTALNPIAFVYGNGGRSVQGLATTSILTDKFPGFLNHYSTTGVEEDKAEVFAHMMVNFDYVKQRTTTDPILQAKVKQMRRSLFEFCAKMDDEFWRKIQNTKRGAPQSDGSDKESQPMRSLDELMLFFPSKFPDGNWQPKNLVYEDVWFNADDGTRIHAWYCPCKNPRAVVLYAHGNAGNLSHRAGIMSTLQNQLKVSSLFFDYRGYGRSEGTPTTACVVSDTKAAATFLAKHANVKQSDLILMGRSLGGAVVIQLATDVQPRGLVVESSFASLKQIAAHHYPRLAWLVPRNKLDSKTKIKQYKGSLLQSHGTGDRTIPFSSGEELFRAANQPKRFLKIANADHNDAPTKDYYNELNKFVNSLGRSGR